MNSNSKHFMRAVADLVEDEAVLGPVGDGLAAGKEVTWAAHELIKRAALTPAQAAAVLRELDPASAEGLVRDSARAPTVDLSESEEEIPTSGLETIERDPRVRPPSERLASKKRTSRRSRAETASLKRRRALNVGDTLNERFRLEEEIGHGAQGVVYRAYDSRLERDVAVKVLRTDAPGAARERFVREAQALSTIQHRGIVTVFDAGQEGNALYFAMEFVSGRSLQVLIDAEGQLPAERLVPILERAAAAIHYAHDQGLVHRDLKPGNLLLDEDDVPRIVDFGLVALTEGTRLTVTRGVVGTPVYMAPEQAEGGRVTRRADVYSLGAILYEGLTGEPPFSGATPMEIFRKVVQDDPPPLRHFCEGVSPAMEAVCRRAMAKDPRARYPTAVAFARDLRFALEGDHVAAPGLGVWVVRTWDRWHRRRPVLLGMLIGVGVGAVGGGAAVAGLTWRAEARYAVHVPAEEQSASEGASARAANRQRLLGLARQERLRGDPEAAFDWLGFVTAEDLARDPLAWRDHVAAYAHEALAWLELGEAGQAREALARATAMVQAKEGLPAVYYAAHAGLAVAQQQWATASENVRWAIQTDPQDPDALLALVLNERVEQAPGRSRCLGELEAAHPDALWPRYARLVLLASGDPGETQPLAEELLKLAPQPEVFPLAQALAVSDPEQRTTLLDAAATHPRLDPRSRGAWR